MNEVRDAFSLARSQAATMAESTLYPVALVTDGEWLAYRSGPPAGQLSSWLAACDGGAPLLESMLPEIRLLALRLALRRGLPAQGLPPRLAEPADWLAARILLLEWRQVALGLDELAALDDANRRAAELAAAAGLAWRPALPVLLSGGRGEGGLQGWSPRPAQPGAGRGVAAALDASRRARAGLAGRFEKLLNC
ncbi:hypothetical protein KIF53_18460 [Chromobacterium subtsugae]|uniref:Uncharacterized protein n=2 Tax=Chromobacterium subtsugae TaxID=251747 RepID=A0ABS7FHS4_9NEIS|nr:MULTISPECIES: hypothetical protein [Chromobacterium]KZE85264.1 hypothetical protein AWB61_02460 [Chromobacterium sp. F49]MBW7568449.1 hypothetical protein [Chromobacterium subtsugae]MBW8289624.1 hypothetical protein [Chromobacterium subtsugae]WSE92560.1 hypothetical protein U6115_04730 [Chromobacterium subtsugae]WVH60938.1 hypothetical protein U6151_04750 [Chromobacterium subtsugae]